MKKMLAILLSLALLLALAACGETAPAPAPEPEVTPAPAPEAAPAAETAPAADAEPAAEDEPEPVLPGFPPLEEPLLPAEQRIPGDWYGLHQGLLFCLSLSEDGSFTLAVSGAETAPVEGSWLVEGNCLYLNGADAEPLLVFDDSLLWEAVGLRFTREMPETFTPAEEFYDLKPGDADGLWRCHFVGAGGVIVEAEALGDDTMLYIEGENVALGGFFFGDIPLAFTFEDGAMVARLDEGDATAVLTIRLQTDGVLRLSLETKGEASGPVTFYLLPQTPANAELPAEP